jgi:predicted secreted protein
LQGLKSWGSNVDQLWVPTDAGLQALRDAFLSGDELFAEFADADGYGFKGKVLVTGMDMDQPLEGGVTLPITLTGTGALETLSPA